jgi:HEAT repeat protein
MIRRGSMAVVLLAVLWASTLLGAPPSALDTVESRLKSEPTVGDLIKSLGDKEELHRAVAASALGELGPDAREAIPALTVALGDKSNKVRSRAFSALGSIGPAAKSAVPLLIKGMRDKDKSVRWSSAWALGRLGPAAGKAVPDLVAALNDQDPDVASCAVEALGSIGPGAKAAVPALIGWLKDDRSPAVADALGKIGPAAKAAIPPLTTMRDTDDPRAHKGPDMEFWRQANGHARIAAALALWKVDRQAKSIRLLMDTLEDKAKAYQGRLSHVRLAAVDALSEIGPAAKAATPLLLVALKDEDYSIRRAAAEALGRIGAAPARTVPALRKALDDEVSYVQEAAAESLGRMGPSAKAAGPRLAAILKAGEGVTRDFWEPQSVRLAAATALWKIDRDAAKVVPALIQLLKADEPPISITSRSYGRQNAAQLRRRAAEVLGEIGAPAKAARSRLSELAKKDKFLTVREAAAIALGRIEGKGTKKARVP